MRNDMAYCIHGIPTTLVRGWLGRCHHLREKQYCAHYFADPSYPPLSASFALLLLLFLVRVFTLFSSSHQPRQGKPTLHAQHSIFNKTLN
jgi:hypothetical protein